MYHLVVVKKVKLKIMGVYRLFFAAIDSHVNEIFKRTVSAAY